MVKKRIKKYPKGLPSFGKYRKEVERTKVPEYREQRYKIYEKQKKEYYKGQALREAGVIKEKPFLSKLASRLQSSRKETARRAKSASAIVSLLGVGKPQRVGAGRPSGTYKYGMPIQVYKKLQARQKALYQAYQLQQVRQLAQRGLTPEQVQQLELQRVVTSREVLQPREIQMPDKKQQMSEVLNQADEDLKFRKFLAEKTISPRTQEILLRLRKTQLKGARDDLEMQRRLEERRMVADAGNLMKTPFIFKTHQIDVTGVSEDNILKAPNVFKEDPENFILRKRARNILDTKGNTLRF